MLAIQAFHPGAAALLSGERVRIHQINGDGSILCLRDKGTYTAQPGELKEIPADATPVRLWLLDRVDISDRNARSRLWDAIDDFRAWADAQDMDDGEAITAAGFRRAIRAAGGHTVLNSEKVWGRRHRIMCLVGRIRSGSL